MDDNNEILKNHQPQNDLLCNLFKDQGDFEHFLGYRFADMSEKERGAYVLEHSVMVCDELHEMFHEMPFFKSWKKYSDNPADNAIMWQKARMEFVDALHFFIAVAIALGFTPEELFAMYQNKLLENYKRQNNTASYKRAIEREDNNP